MNRSISRKYDVILHVPMGERPGELLIQTENGSVRGELRLLRQRTELTGIIREDGSMKIEGELVTLMRRVPYLAEGRISGHDIQLMLHAGDTIYELTGTEKKEEAGEQA